MPRKAMKCIVEVDLHVVTCPGTFLKDYEYVYMHMEMLGLEARTKSVPPTFPLFYHERLKFERTFTDCTDPGLIASILKDDIDLEYLCEQFYCCHFPKNQIFATTKRVQQIKSKKYRKKFQGEDIILELRQHTDYVTDGKVIAHCSSNTHDFLYPAIPPYYGSGREILLYKTSKFKPIRVTGEPVKLEFSTKTIIKEIPDYDSPEADKAERVTDTQVNRSNSTLEGSFLEAHNETQLTKKSKSKSTTDLTKEEDKGEFVIRRKDDNLLSNRDFSTYVRPKSRRSISPVRSSSMRRSVSPTRAKKIHGNTTVESIPAWRYSSILNSSARHARSITDPTYNATLKSLRYALDDLEVSESRRLRNRYRTFTSPNVIKALNSSKRIQRRVDDMLYKTELLDSDLESDLGLDLLRESLREERNTLNDAIKAADREAFYRSLNRTR